MSWQPENSNLNQLLTILRDAISPSNKEQAILQQVLFLYFIIFFWTYNMCDRDYYDLTNTQNIIHI